MSVLAFERPDFMRAEEIVLFEDSVGKFFDAHAPESRVAKWREAGVVERAMWNEAGAAGLLCLAIPETYGGMGGAGDVMQGLMRGEVRHGRHDLRGCHGKAAVGHAARCAAGLFKAINPTKSAADGTCH